MKETFNATDINIGYHPTGYRINKTESALNLYTRWKITTDKQWINSKPTCFHSLPQDGWYKVDSFDLKNKDM